MLQGLYKRRLEIGVGLGWVCKRTECYSMAVVLQVLAHEHGMVHLLLGLDLEPVFIAQQAFSRIVVCHIQIEIGRVELFVDLFSD